MADDGITHEEFAELKEDVKSILKLLNGNGSAGVFTRLDRLEQWRAACEERLDREGRAETESRERVWEIAKPFIVNAINLGVTVVLLIVFLHLPSLAAAFGLKVGP